jgi:hypothetical protein
MAPAVESAYDSLEPPSISNTSGLCLLALSNTRLLICPSAMVDLKHAYISDDKVRLVFDSRAQMGNNMDFPSPSEETQ